MASARTMANAVIMTDSPINWVMSCPLFAPTTLRTPTSFARCVERAVVRFMKLMQAISRTTSATAENV